MLKRSVYSVNEIDRNRNDNVRLTLPCSPPADQSLTTDTGLNTGTNTTIASFNIPITTIFFPPFSIGGALTSWWRAAPTEAAKKTSSYRRAGPYPLLPRLRSRGALPTSPAKKNRSVGPAAEPRMAAWRLSSPSTHPLFRLLPPCLVSWLASKRVDHLWHHLALGTSWVNTPTACSSSTRGGGWLPLRQSRGCRSLTG